MILLGFSLFSGIEGVQKQILAASLTSSGVMFDVHVLLVLRQ